MTFQIADFRLRIAEYELRMIRDCGFWIAEYELTIRNCGFWIAIWGILISNLRFVILDSEMLSL